MRLDRIIQTLLPHDEKFFSFFDELARLIVQTAEILSKLPALPFEERTSVVEEIHSLEHQADAITHKVYQELNSTFVTPFDREDIHLLASTLDDVLDSMDGTASRMVLYKVRDCPPEVLQLIGIIRLSAIELQRAIALLGDLRRAPEIQAVIQKVNEYENEGDDIFDQAVANLFDTEKDAVKILKMKEILVTLETATDKCEDVANVLESILIKNA